MAVPAIEGNTMAPHFKGRSSLLKVGLGMGWGHLGALTIEMADVVLTNSDIALTSTRMWNQVARTCHVTAFCFYILPRGPWVSLRTIPKMCACIVMVRGEQAMASSPPWRGAGRVGEGPTCTMTNTMKLKDTKVLFFFNFIIVLVIVQVDGFF